MSYKSANLRSALEWLTHIVSGCLKVHFRQAQDFVLNPPNFHSDKSWLAKCIELYKPSYEELTVLMLAIAPHLRPGFFGKLIADYLPEGGDFPEFGGVKGTNHRGILPTGETAQFILAGDDIEKRLEVQRILSSEHWFAQKAYSLA